MAVIDGGGTIPPALGTAAELVRRGHSVMVLADPTVAASAQWAGCRFTPWRAAPHFDSRADQTALLAAVEGGNLVRRFTTIRDLLTSGSTALYAGEVVAAAQEHPVDAVLVEAALPGILIGALATGLPTAALMANVYMRPTPGLPMMGTGWRPGTGVLGRGRDALVRGAVQGVTSRFLPGLNATLSAHSLLPIGDLFELLDRCTDVLVLTSPSFDFASPHIPSNVHYVGPYLEDPEWAAAEDWHPRSGGGPLVLVATSSIFQHQTSLLRRVATALGQLPVRAVLTTGRAVDPADIPAPANVRVLRAAPHRLILREASVVITHAGHGSVLKALAAGVPLVCMPMGRDQKDNTVRVLRLGAGVRVGKSAKPARIAEAVRRVLDDPAYSAAARRFADVLSTEARSRPTAADRAEALLPG
jgi:UDP:flavonoid glycosyltransferase YjiC (YdhE family)